MVSHKKRDFEELFFCIVVYGDNLNKLLKTMDVLHDFFVFYFFTLQQHGTLRHVDSTLPVLVVPSQTLTYWLTD